MGESQSTFSDMVSELGLAAAMRPKTEYTILAPVNAAFTRESIFQTSLLERQRISYFVFYRWNICKLIYYSVQWGSVSAGLASNITLVI